MVQSMVSEVVTSLMVSTAETMEAKLQSLEEHAYDASQKLQAKRVYRGELCSFQLQVTLMLPVGLRVVHTMLRFPGAYEASCFCSRGDSKLRTLENKQRR